MTTVFDDYLNQLTIKDMASILVKPCVVNRNELYYITTTGQLFPFSEEGLNSAIKLEMQFLSSPSNKTTESDNKSDQISIDDYIKELHNE